MSAPEPIDATGEVFPSVAEKLVIVKLSVPGRDDVTLRLSIEDAFTFNGAIVEAISAIESAWNAEDGKFKGTVSP